MYRTSIKIICIFYARAEITTFCTEKASRNMLQFFFLYIVRTYSSFLEVNSKIELMSKHNITSKQQKAIYFYKHQICMILFIWSQNKYATLTLAVSY
jgi:hypothetical protein